MGTPYILWCASLTARRRLRRAGWAAHSRRRPDAGVRRTGTRLNRSNRTEQHMGEMEVFYTKLLAVPAPWSVREVRLDLAAGRVDVWLAERAGTRWVCPECGAPAAVYDHAPDAVWQHLDTCQLQTFVHARLPRTQCSVHGVRQAPAPWASPRSGLTMAQESRVIDTLLECDVSGASRLTGLSWGRIWRVQQQAVERGRARKVWRVPAQLGIDEKSFAKRHCYETVVCDLAAGTVEFVADDRKKESLGAYYMQFSPAELAGVEVVTMDMWGPFITATQTFVPEAEKKIVFDRFHVVRYVTAAVDQVRRREHKALRLQHDERLNGTKHIWLANEENVPVARRREFAALRRADLQTGRAWAIKEAFRRFWDYHLLWRAKDYFRRWFFWATHSQLTPMIAAAKTIRAHLPNILTYFAHRVTNATAEGINSKIQMVKEMACGFRNREHYKTAIYFHCGGLDLHPRPSEG